MIYLDNAATSWPKPPGTADAVAEAILHPLGNPGRTSHGPGIAADRLLFGLREILADFLKVKDSSRILFTSGTTQSVNTVLYGFLKPGDRVLTSSMEHNAVMRPLRALESSRGIEVAIVAGDDPFETLHVPEDQSGPLVGREPPGEPDGQMIRAHVGLNRREFIR